MKKMKKMTRNVLSIVLVLAMVLLCGCGNGAGGTEPEKQEVQATEGETKENEAEESSKEEPKAAEEESGEGEEYVLGIAFSAFEEFHVEWLKYAEEVAAENNIKIITTNAQNNISTQMADIESLIVQKPDAIMVWAVDADGMVNAVEGITAAGIPCILSSYSVNTDQYDLYLYEDQILTGQLQADYCKEWVEKHPGETLNCGYIWGVTGISGCIERYDGWKDNCVDGETIVLLDEQIGNWSTDEAMAITEDWLQAYPEMNCIVCMSDEMALGAIQALQGANKDFDDYLIIGIDGSESAQLELDKGTLDATVFQNRYLNAKLQMEAVAGLIKGEPVEEKDLLIKAKQLMTSENKEEILSSLER